MKRVARFLALVAGLAALVVLAACNQTVTGGNVTPMSAWTGTWKGHIDYQASYNAGYHSTLTLQVSVNGTSITGTGTVYTYNDSSTASWTASGSFTGTLSTTNGLDAYLYCSTASGYDGSYSINSCSDLSWTSTHVIGDLTSNTTATVSLPDMKNNTVIGDPAFGSIALTKQ